LQEGQDQGGDYTVELVKQMHEITERRLGLMTWWTKPWKCNFSETNLYKFSYIQQNLRISSNL